MRVADRLNLIERIGVALQTRYTFDDIDRFFAGFDISPPARDTYNSKRLYAKDALKDAQEPLLLRIARELDLTPPPSGAGTTPPKNWTATKHFRLFISHVSKDKLVATRLKEALTPHRISGFVAHEDIHPTLEWQHEIERALATMDALVAVHTPGFALSSWTQQEIGFALGRGTKIISFKMGEDPTGFLSRHQALARRSRTAEAIAGELAELLKDDARTAARLKDAQALTSEGGVTF